jgi:hypothetical protein
MAKIQHLYSTTAGHVPASLSRGQLGVNFPDKLVYAATPDGKVKTISSGNAGIANASSLLGVHIPVNLHPIAQFAPGYTETDLGTKFSDDGTTATLQTVPIFMFGTLWYTPTVACPSVTSGAYQLTMDCVARTVSMQGFVTPHVGSGSLNYATKQAQIVIRSDGHIYPWFYVPETLGQSNGPVMLFRISPYKTFGAIPVSAGFAGAAATSYWGAP